MKYVIIKTEIAGCARAFAFIFPGRLTHSEMAEGFLRAMRKEFNRPAEVYSAGFCGLDGSRFRVWQHGSESLRIEENKEHRQRDADILNLPAAFQNMLMDEPA